MSKKIEKAEIGAAETAENPIQRPGAAVSAVFLTAVVSRDGIFEKGRKADIPKAVFDEWKKAGIVKEA